MFTFRSIELMNWDVWSHVRLPMDEQVVLITGPNGSGKTTFLDAVRVLLNASKLSTSRKLGGYLHDDTEVALVKAVVSNPLRRGTGRRPFSARGIFEDEVTLACRLSRKKGRWQRQYHILGGDVPLAEIREASGGLGPMEYSRELTRAQVPRTLLRVLALEQGETHRLARRSPEQLLEYVLEMQGDKEVLERYETARGTFVASEKALADFEERLEVTAVRVAGLKREADQVREWDTLVAEERTLREERLPAARFKAVGDQLEAQRAEVAKATAVLRNADDVLAQFHGDVEKLKVDAEQARSSIAEGRSAYQRLLGAKEKLDARWRDLRRARTELVESFGARADEEGFDLAAALADEDGSEDLTRLDAERQQAAQAESSLRAELTGVVDKVMALRREVQELSGSDRRPPPHWVREMLSALQAEGIEAMIVADVIEVMDPHWHVAVESVLGRERFTVLVDERDRLAARRLAQKLKYRCYVSDLGPRHRLPAREQTALSVVSLKDDRVPEHIQHMLNSVTLVETVEAGARLGKRAVSITPDGYRQDQRGGIFVGTQDLYCGTGAQTARLRQAEDELGRLRARRDELQRSLEPFRRRLADIDEQRAAARGRHKLREKVGDPSTLDARIEALTAERREASASLVKMLADIDTANAAVVEHERKIGLLEYRHREQLLERDRARSTLSQSTSRRARLESELSELERNVPEALKTEAAQALLEPEVTLIERLNLLRDRMGRFAGSRDPRSIAVWKNAAEELAEQERALQERRRELDTHTAELELARRAYARVVEETIKRYRRNVMRLGELCRVDVEVRAPGLEHLRRRGESVIGHTGLEVRIGFDGKRPVPVDDPRLSGGQSVVSSLILLMALTMEDTGQAAGFFILDEPFAHLSVERIDEVARFLGVTRAQFVITTPTTHNLLVYNPARLTLNLRKKAGDARFAPVPTFLRR